MRTHTHTHTHACGAAASAGFGSYQSKRLASGERPAFPVIGNI